MRIIFPIAVVIALVVIGYAGGKVGSLNYLVGVIVPYAAVVVFLGGIVYQVVGWARVPVPFRIPTTAGQEKSFPWVKHDKVDNPSSTLGVIARMVLEVFLFRSLFRSTKAHVDEGPRFSYSSSKWLWGVGLMFHWSFLIIFLRHFRLFIEPVPFFVHNLEFMDGFMQLYLPTFYLTDAVLVGAVTYLFLRRVLIPQVRYISLSADYFPLFLILSIAISGIFMRYITKTDIVGVKEMVQGLMRFSPSVPEGIGAVFFMHIFLVSALLAYFPFSKLVHMPGVFMSPTRNLSNNSRVKRHINPWNPDIKFHTYEEYEEDFWKVMQSVDLPLDKEYKEEEKEEKE
jgi:nitrate reductase gamma subunit